MLTGVRPRHLVGKAASRTPSGLVVDLERIYQRTKTANKELIELITTPGTA